MTVSLIPVQLRNTTIPDARLGVFIAPGADLADDPDLWTFYDITEDVRFAEDVTISIGRSDEQSQAQPASCTFTVMNDSGDYTPRRASGAYYPNMRLGFPVKVSVFSTVTGEVEEFTGFVDEIVPGWDASTKVPTATITAKGPIQRIQQGDAPRQATVNRAALDTSLRSTVAAYWPMDEAADETTTTFGSGIGASPLNITGGTMNFASYDGFPGSNPLPTFQSGVNINGPVDGPASTSGAVYFRCLLYAATVLTDGTILFRFSTTGSLRTFRLAYGVGGELDLRCFNSADVQTDSTGFISFGINGRPFYLSVELVQNGANVDILMFVRRINADGTTTGGLITDSFAGTVGSCTRIDMGGSGTMTDWAVGHVGIANDQDWLFSSSDLLTGYRGETVDDRVNRVCAAASVNVSVSNTSDVALGPEGTSTLMDTLREAELADDGVLYDGFGFGLIYHCRRRKQNRAVGMALDIRDGDVMPPFSPVENTQFTRNTVTVTRKDGSSATAVQDEGQPYAPTGDGGVGTYEDSLTLNVSTDTVLPGQAQWRVHKGTVDLDRYPSLEIDFTASPSTLLDWLQSGSVGCRVTVTGLPETAGRDPDLFVEGYTLVIGQKDYRVSLNCSPAPPYDVALVATDRVASRGSVLSTAALMGATSITVDTDPPGRWGTSAGTFLLSVGGHKVTCTAISGAGTIQTFTITALPAPVPAGAIVQVWRPATVALEGAT